MYTEHQVKLHLEDAGKTIMMLPKDRGPASKGSFWPDHMVEFEDQIGAAKKANTRTVIRPTKEQIDNLDMVLTWIPMLKNIIHREMVCKRILRSPYTGKPKYSYRKLGEMFGISHQAAKDRYEHGIMHITRKLNGGKMSHTNNKVDPARKEMLAKRRFNQLNRKTGYTDRNGNKHNVETVITGKYVPGNGSSHTLGWKK